MFSPQLAQQLRNMDVCACGKAAQSIQNANWDAGGSLSACVCTGHLRCTSHSLTLPLSHSLGLPPRCVLIPLTSKLGIGGRVDFEPLLLLQARGERWKSGRDGRFEDPRHGAQQSPAAAARAARSMHVKDTCPQHKDSHISPAVRIDRPAFEGVEGGLQLVQFAQLTLLPLRHLQTPTMAVAPSASLIAQRWRGRTRWHMQAHARLLEIVGTARTHCCRDALVTVPHLVERHRARERSMWQKEFFSLRPVSLSFASSPLPISSGGAAEPRWGRGLSMRCWSGDQIHVPNASLALATWVFGAATPPASVSPAAPCT